MMFKASVLLVLWLAYQGQCQFLSGFGSSRDDYIRNYLNWRANTGPGQLWPPRPAARRDVEETTERDREPIDPDYIKNSEGDIDGSETETGVIDVDANADGSDFFGSDLFPDIGNHPSTNVYNGLGGFPNLFNLFGGFRTPTPWWNGYRVQPWWKGPNVCIERHETTENEDDDKNSTDADYIFSSMINLSSCHESLNKYECTTKSNVRGVMKSFTIKYQCCYGYRRSRSGPGCEKLNLKSLPDEMKEIDAKEFLKMCTNTKVIDQLTEGNFTIFLPLDKSITDFAEDMSVINQVELARRKRDLHNALTSKDFVLNHLVKGFVDLSDVQNEDILESSFESSSIRINFFPTKTGERLITANCVPVRKPNIYAENGIVHLIDGVLPPATITFDDILKGSQNIKMFRTAWKNAGLSQFELEQKFNTILIPTDEAFEKLPKDTREKLMSGDSCALNILRHHIISHTVCTSAINGNVSTHNIDGYEFSMQRTDDDKLMIEDDVEIIKPDIVYKNGVAHLIDTVMLPDSGLHFMQILKKHNFTRFEKLIKRFPELSEELNNYNSSSFFVPSNEAFSEVDDLLDGEKKLSDDEIIHMIKYHIVPKKIDLCDFHNNELLNTEAEATARVNLYSTLPIFSTVINRATVNCARITDIDIRSCGSVVHVIDRVMIPPKENIFDIISNDPKYSILIKIINDTEIKNVLSNDSLSITFLAPTDEALEQVSEKDIDSLVNDKKKAEGILKNHILKEVMCCSGIGSTPWNFNNYIQTMAGTAKEISRNVRHQVRIGSSTVTKCDIIATNGVIQEVNKIMFPARRNFANFGLFLFDF